MSKDAAAFAINPFVGLANLGAKAVGGAINPEAPEAPSFAPPPSPEDPEVAKELADASSKQRKAKGRASTIFAGATGGPGASGAPSLARRTLLGA